MHRLQPQHAQSHQAGEQSEVADASGPRWTVLALLLTRASDIADIRRPTAARPRRQDLSPVFGWQDVQKNGPAHSPPAPCRALFPSRKSKRRRHVQIWTLAREGTVPALGKGRKGQSGCSCSDFGLLSWEPASFGSWVRSYQLRVPLEGGTHWQLATRCVTVKLPGVNFTGNSDHAPARPPLWWWRKYPFQSAC